MEGIIEFTNENPGFTALVEGEGWTVGIVNYTERLNAASLIKRERHLLTDELFIPILGDSCLHIGIEMALHPLEIGKSYLVKKGVWHALSLSPDAKVFVVENPGTGPNNTEYHFFSE